MNNLKIKLETNADQLIEKLVQVQKLVEEINQFELTINALDEADNIVSSTRVEKEIIIQPIFDCQKIQDIINTKNLNNEKHV